MSTELNTATSTTNTTKGIVHVPRRFVEHEWGGTEAVISSLTKEQVNDGWSPRIHTSLALSNQKNDAYQGVPVKRYSYSYPFLGLNIDEIHALDKKGGNLLSLSLFAGLMREPDVRVFHAHTLKRLGGEVMTAARLRKKPFVVTLHGGVFDVPQLELAEMTKPQEGKFEWGKAFGALFRSRAVLHDADAIICIGKGEFEGCKKAVAHDRVHLIGNGVHPEKFANGDAIAFRKKNGIPEQAFLISCICRFDPQKNHPCLVRAFEKFAKDHPDAWLFMAGPETLPQYVDKLDEQIAKTNVAAKIIRTGPLDPDSNEIVDAYHACDVFTLPSRHEPFGIVVLEAWASGKPVITSQVGGLKDLVINGETGLSFPDNDHDALAHSLSKLATDNELRHRLAEYGSHLMKEKYTWPKIHEQIMGVYDQAEERMRGH